MDGLRNPIGDEPAQVYWKRRLIAVVGIVAVILVIWFLISAATGGDDSGAPTDSSPAATTSASPAAASGSGDSASRACGSDDIGITTTANPASVGADALPVFDVGLAQTGSSACLIDTDADGTELLITSGDDRIYSSMDCPDDNTIASTQLVLEPGASEDLAITWNRQRSLPDCATETAVPGAGTYNATVTVQGIQSEPAVFTLE
ncbi:hypothetical protein [Demequina aurantiaca]|uniref:hypothetical protein n=1 Tax=Demequina aurantiaca TaxID=676200 RepID=UPI003D347945